MGKEEIKVGDLVKWKGTDNAGDYDSAPFGINKSGTYDVISVDGSYIQIIPQGGDKQNDVSWHVMTKDFRKFVPRTSRKTHIKLPTEKIEKHHIIGQDVNKDILQKAITKELPVLLIGETGTGKTSIIREQAIDQSKDIVRFSITGETTVDEFVGKYELENGATIWRDGVLLDAMKTGKWLVCDEVNVALPEILFVLHSLLDDDKFVTVSNHLGEVVKPHDDFRFFATMNPPEEYAGTKELNKAFQSRFAVVLVMHYPPAPVEAKIVADKTGIEIADATKMADVAVALRKAKQDEKIFYTCSTRDLLHWGDLCSVLDPGEAFRVSVLNKAGTDKEAIMEVYKHVIGRYVKLEEDHPQLTIDWLEEEYNQLEKDKVEFESNKEEQRRQITQDIIQKLTNGEDVHEPKAIDTKADVGVATPALDDIFATEYAGK